MTVERFFNENRVAIKVEMEIGSNEAIKQAMVGVVSIVPACFGTGRQRSTHDSGCGGFQSKPLVCSLSASKQLSVVANTFLEYLLAGKQIAEQTTLEVMQDIVDPGVRDEGLTQRG